MGFGRKILDSVLGSVIFYGLALDAREGWWLLIGSPFVRRIDMSLSERQSNDVRRRIWSNRLVVMLFCQKPSEVKKNWCDCEFRHVREAIVRKRSFQSTFVWHHLITKRHHKIPTNENAIQSVICTFYLIVNIKCQCDLSHQECSRNKVERLVSLMSSPFSPCNN